MRPTESTRLSFVFTGALALTAALGACTYDFDKFEQASSTSGGAPGVAGAGAGSAGKPASEGGEAGESTSPGGGTASSRGGAASSGGISGTGAAGGSSGGTSGRGNAGGSGGAIDCSAVAGTVWNAHCYFVVGVNRGVRWEAARAECSQNGGAHLVTVTTAAEQAMLEQTFGRAGDDDFWIGLSLQNVSSNPDRTCQRNPDQCPFLWVGGEPLAYTNWAEHSAVDREPNYTGACVRVQGSDFRWADLGCTSQLAALCEHDGG